MQIPCWLRILNYFTQKDFCNLHKAVKKKEEYFGRILERNGQVCVPPKMGHEATKLRLLPALISSYLTLALFARLLLATNLHFSYSKTQNLSLKIPKWKHPGRDCYWPDLDSIPIWQPTQLEERTVYQGRGSAGQM